MNILIADELAPEGAAYLASQAGVQVEVKTGLSGDALAELMRRHDGMVVRSAVKVTGPVIDRCFQAPARMKAIARAGVGVDNIDCDAATRHGVAVMNSASASTITTAEHAFALMIALARNVAHAHMAMAGGAWDRDRFTGHQLFGKTLGVVGFGRIGQTMAQRALAFGMKVVGFDPLVNTTAALDGRVPMLASFDDLIRAVDIVSFHVPKTETTSGMLGAAQFAAARPGLLVVNAARGGVVDETALLAAIEAGHCGGAALDVFPKEPLAKDSPLRNHPRLLLTPHLGASTVEAQEAVAVDACKALVTYLRGEGFPGAVNAGGLQVDLTDRQRAFVDLARRMVALLRAAAGPIRLQHVTFTLRGDSLADRADTIARMALADLLQAQLDEPVNLINAALIAEQRGIASQTIIASAQGDDRLSIEVRGGDAAVPSAGAGSFVVEGAIYADGRPRITSLNGYAMDMIPAGRMIVLTNADRPGRLGLVGQMFGQASVNIAEMVIGRKPAPAGATPVAMMILKLDDPAPDALLDSLRKSDGILSVAAVSLAPH
jgi:D-3-phosphoglycerate dehydrogenase